MESDILSFSKSSDSTTVMFNSEELNLFNIDEISNTFMDHIKDPENSTDLIYFDFENVNSIDSSSVAFLVRAHLHAKKNKGKLILRNVPENLKKTLDFANLLKDFEVQ